MTTTIYWQETIIAQGRLIELINQEVTIDGKTRIFEFARSAPWVRMIIRSLDDHNKILLSREYRSELDRYDYRLPGGKVFDTLAEYHDNMWEMTTYIEQAVIREAHEEVGIDVSSMKYLSVSHCGATILWDLYYYEITDYMMWDQHLEEWEIITYDYYDTEIVQKMCLDGSINEERSAIALLKYLQ